jgi:phage baseplate assembly protein W
MAYKTLSVKPATYSENKTIKLSQIYKGFSTVDPQSRDVRLYDFDLIKQDIINQFSVRKNERVMNPEFGTIIWDCIYDPFTEDLKTEIANDITRIVGSDPRVNATEVNITEQDFGMILEITLEYVNTDQTEVMSLTFDKSLGLSVQ